MTLLHLRALLCGVALASSAGACGAFGADASPSSSGGVGGAGDEAGTGSDEGGDPNVNEGGTATDGGQEASIIVPGAPCDGRAACDRVVFVTSNAFAPTFAGVGGGDALCNTAAAASTIDAIKKRQFVAWLSDGTTKATVRHIHGMGKYVRPDGVIIANDWNGLTKPPLVHPIQVTETGVVVLGPVWTGSLATGIQPSGGQDANSCTNWMHLALGADTGIAGDCTEVGSAWSNTPPLTPCGNAGRLYCIEK